MENKTKKNPLTQSLHGYIHNVSSLKQGAKRPHFEAQIQKEKQDL